MEDALISYDFNKFDKELETYLNKNGVEDTNISKKEIYKKLKKIIDSSKVDLDCVELRYTKNPGSMTVDEYLKQIHNIQINITEGHYFLYGMVDLVEIEKRKLRLEARQKKFEKIKKMLKPKKNN